jgi:hypothetical protein
MPHYYFDIGILMMRQRTRKRQFITNDLDGDPSIRRHRTRAPAQRLSGSIPWEFSNDGDGIICHVPSIPTAP